jgi:sec-independent protein translocase protein TatA
VPVLGNIIGPELLIVLAVVALLFGSTRLPQLARSLGSAKGEFERGLRDRDRDDTTSSRP